MKFSLSLKPGRIWELDFLKGIALIFMIFDHTVFDLGAFFGVNTEELGFFEEGIGHVSAAIFMTVCGISVTLGKRNVRRGTFVFLLGMALTLGTFAADRIFSSDLLIAFGILHFLGLAMIITHFVKRLPVPAILALAVCSAGVGIWFSDLTVKIPLLFPFGLCESGFYSSDYFPLFPNLAYTFAGAAVGKVIYSEKRSLFDHPGKSSFICFIGRYTLPLYFIHQPVILGLLYIAELIFRF